MRTWYLGKLYLYLDLKTYCSVDITAENDLFISNKIATSLTVLDEHLFFIFSTKNSTKYFYFVSSMRWFCSLIV